MCVLLSYITLFAGLLARSQYSEGSATGYLGTGFSGFLCVYKQMLRWFPRLQVATACFSCSPPDLNLLDPYFIFMLSYFVLMYMHNNHCLRVTAHLQLNILLLNVLLLVLSDSFCVTTHCTVTLNGQTARYDCVIICGGGFEKFLVEYTISGTVKVTARS